MENKDFFRWIYDTLITGHEGPLIVIVILTIVGFSFAVWKGYVGFPQLAGEKEHRTTEKIGEAFMEKMNEKFMSRTECKTHQEDCSEVIADTLVGLNKSITDIHDSVENLRKEKTQETKELAFFMGQVDTFMKNRHGGEHIV